MNGPEHYREAETRLAQAREYPAGHAGAAGCIAEAQVHATLAFVAITADSEIEKLANNGSEVRRRVVSEWAEAVS